MEELVIPEVIECHQGEAFKSFGWHYRDMFRHCGYCGSLHPEDLLDVLSAGGSLQETDWKYGWPHKHYVYFHNGEWAGKWYNTHLIDVYHEPTFKVIAEALRYQTNIKWTLGADGVNYYALYEGGNEH